MCAGVFSDGVSWAAMAFIVNQAGFDQTTESICSLLADLYVRYLKLLAKTSVHLAQLQGRTLVNFEDVINMLDFLRVDCGEGLVNFCSDWTRQRMFAPLDGNTSHEFDSENGETVLKWLQILEPREFPIDINNILIGDKDLSDCDDHKEECGAQDEYDTNNDQNLNSDHNSDNDHDINNSDFSTGKSQQDINRTTNNTSTHSPKGGINTTEADTSDLEYKSECGDSNITKKDTL